MAETTALLSTPLIAEASAADPFYTIRDRLDGEIRASRSSFEDWQGLFSSSCNTATDIRFRVKQEEFQKVLTKNEDACRKLKNAVGKIAKERSRYPHVDDRELERRRALVSELDTSLNAMRTIFYSKEVKARFEADQRKQLHERAVSDVESAARGANAYAKSNADFMTGQAQQQSLIKREQDVALGTLSTSLARVGQMATAINDELKSQDKIMDDIGQDMDKAQTKMDAAIQGVEKLLKTKNRSQMFTICILLVVFVILGIVAFYTLTS